ncbi:ROK family protein [Thermosphaera chiliense]|uniref:ROK family protein n=1 Tax=Thermosphaera chiliense TaxID=3402707 RepID=A0A7M1UR72_9CREN|nr:ROK family protein [Thermosphaera aggregans]QOR94027.1 ROK family protein [Thermosphaera aggregans]
MKYYLAIDLGASKTRIAVCSKGSIIGKIVETTPKQGDEYTIARFIWEGVMKHFPEYIENIEAVGVASIGPLDVKRGVAVNPTNLPFKEIKLLEPLTKYFKARVIVANDAVAAAWGEKNYGLGKPFRNLIYLTLSTGIGAGVIVDNHLLIGKEGNAHEVGHIVVDFNSELECGCGGRGHWEAFAGGINIPRVAKWLASKHGINSDLLEFLMKHPEATAKDVFEYYRRGDRLAELVVDLYVKASRAGIASIINTYDPELLVIGGGVFLNNQDILFERMLDGLENDVVTSKPIIKPTGFGDDVGLYGALALAVNPPRELVEVQGI